MNRRGLYAKWENAAAEREAELEKRFDAFMKGYKHLCAEHGIILTACSCCISVAAVLVQDESDLEENMDGISRNGLSDTYYSSDSIVSECRDHIKAVDEFDAWVKDWPEYAKRADFGKKRKAFRTVIAPAYEAATGETVKRWPDGEVFPGVARDGANK